VDKTPGPGLSWCFGRQ